MGSALAASLLKSGHRLSVWNRTKDKCRPLVKAGAVKVMVVGGVYEGGVGTGSLKARLIIFSFS